MPVSGNEIATLDFSNLIGGPLNAIVEAQAKSGIATANFIQEVGFDQNGDAIYTEFAFSRKDDNGQDRSFSLTVPFLAMLPIPYIAIQSATLEFNARITSKTESTLDSEVNRNVETEGSGGFWRTSASLKSSFSYKKTTAGGETAERTFDMKIAVQARGGEMPAGADRLLTVIETAIEEVEGDSVYSVTVVSNAEAGSGVLAIEAEVDVFDALEQDAIVTFNVGPTSYSGSFSKNDKTLTGVTYTEEGGAGDVPGPSSEISAGTPLVLKHTPTAP